MRVALLATWIAAVGCQAAAPEVHPPANSPYVMMNIVAHEDDDILFMNPELETFIKAGYGSVTVVLTAGEANGAEKHHFPWSTCSLPVKQHRDVFAAARQDAMRNAYAKMAGVRSAWTREEWTIGGLATERDILDEAPQVSLVFLNLRDGGDSEEAYAHACGGQLACLFNGYGHCSDLAHVCKQDSDCAAGGRCDRTTRTFLPRGTAVSHAVTYSRESLIAQLRAIIGAYKPVLIRLPDPHPYANSTAVTACPGTPYSTPVTQVGPDNPDHENTAELAIEALDAIPGRYTTKYYAGYGTSDYQANLGAFESNRKAAVFMEYVGGRDASSGDVMARHALCEAQQMGRECGRFSGYAAWQAATYERYAAGGDWLASLADGRLAAFAVQGQAVVTWLEDSPGGTWTGPVSLGGGPVAPHIATLTLPSGDLVLLVTRLPVGGATPVVEANTRSAATGTWSGWTSLGNPDDPASCGSAPCGDAMQYAPDPPNPDHPRADPGQQGLRLGDPVAAVDESGSAFVFVRNSFGRVSVRPLLGGAWTPLDDPSDWPAYDVLDDLAAATDENGRIEIFASALRGWVPSWTQLAPGQVAFVPGSSAFPRGNRGAVAGPVSVAKDRDGHLHLFWHSAGDANVMTAASDGTGTWSDARDLGNSGTGGTGALAAVARPAGELVVFTRNGDDGLSLVSGDAWIDFQSQFTGWPSVALDARGNPVVAVIGVDTHLYIRRELGAVGMYGPWAKVGN